MRYNDEDIEFAIRVLTCRDDLDEKRVDEWMNDPGHVELLKEFAAMFPKGSGRNFERDRASEYARLLKSIGERRGRRMTFLWSVAASVILLIGLFVGWSVNVWRDLDEERILAQTERNAPGVKAELILGTGEIVSLGQRNELIEGAKEMGIWNDSLAGLNYAIAGMQEGVVVQEMVFNTLRIPVSGFYQLTLADGTRVWLNSVTELRYPVTFSGDERKVYLAGEAYFEVAHDSLHPFIVVTEKIDVKVYGTEFNVNTYREGQVQTVLVNGKVGIRVNSTGEEVALKPGQLAEYMEDTRAVQVKDVDPYSYVAWKDGEFVFEKETIENIMERLNRWYDVNVFYTSEAVKKRRFTGIIDRYDDIEKFLRLIEGPATLRFDLKGNALTVTDAGE